METMKIIVFYTWHRDTYNNDTVTNSVILKAHQSKLGVTKAIREWVKNWTGKGCVMVSSIDASLGDDQKFCDIKQRVFRFNN